MKYLVGAEISETWARTYDLEKMIQHEKERQERAENKVEYREEV